jgi:hypothetical protein
MMNILTKIFWPILRFFETDQVPENYKASHRVSLNVLGVLFVGLSFFAAWAASSSDQISGFIPVVVFFCVGLIAVVVGTIGSKGAVSKIWGTK